MGETPKIRYKDLFLSVFGSEASLLFQMHVCLSETFWGKRDIFGFYLR